MDTSNGQKQNCLQIADSLVSGDRQGDYGHPFLDFQRTGFMAGGLLHEWAKEAGKSETPIALPPELVALFMVLVKISREVNKPKADNVIDGCGYFRTLELVYEYRAQN